jgi:hypothetical protein
MKNVSELHPGVFQQNKSPGYDNLTMKPEMVWQKSKTVPLPPCRRQGGEEYSSYSFLISALDGVNGRHALAVLTPGERTLSTHWIGGWVGLSAGLDTKARRKIICLC